MSRLINALIDEIDFDGEIEKIIVGLKIVGVKIDGKWGLSTISLEEIKDSHFSIRDSGRLHKKSIRELVDYIFSKNPVEASIGMATINAKLPLPKDNIIERNGFDYIKEIARGKRITMVGHFPRGEPLKEIAEKLWILELRPREGDLPASYSPVVIPKSDILIITGATFVNHTIDQLISLANPSCFIAIVGPTTPISKSLFNFGIDLLCSSIVVDEKLFLDHILQGASVKQLKGIKQICLCR